MERRWTTELAGHAGQHIRMAGWLHHQRRLARVTFLLLRDARGIAQVVATDDAVRAHIGALLPETVLEVVGRVGYRERRQRLPDRLVRPHGVPRAESAVLQADHGGCVRTRL